MVTRVIDGDTFDSSPLGRVRLADIDAPEPGEPGSEEAADLLVSLVLAKEVFLDIDDVYGTDIYGRFVCVVYVRHNATHLLNVNKALLDTGVVIVSHYNNEFTPYSWTLYVQSSEPPPPSPLSVAASVYPAQGAIPLTVAFAATALGGTTPYSFLWDFGDGTTSTSQHPSHTYGTASTYGVTVTATDSLGVQAGDSTFVRALTPLVGTASADVTSGDVPLTVSFTGTASGGRPPYTFSWTFGDGSTSELANPTHTYAAAGVYTTTMTVIDADGQAVIRTIEITPESPGASVAPAGIPPWVPSVVLAIVASAVLVLLLWYRRRSRQNPPRQT